MSAAGGASKAPEALRRKRRREANNIGTRTPLADKCPPLALLHGAAKWSSHWSDNLSDHLAKGKPDSHDAAGGIRSAAGRSSWSVPDDDTCTILAHHAPTSCTNKHAQSLSSRN